MKQTQKAWVIERLKASGEISRNECLARRISRLGAIICAMKAEGWNFETVERENDYVYKLLNAPKKKTQVVVQLYKDGRPNGVHVSYVYV